MTAAEDDPAGGVVPAGPDDVPGGGGPPEHDGQGHDGQGHDGQGHDGRGPGGRGPVQRRRRRRRIAVAITLLIVAWLALAAVTMVRAALELHAARDDLDALKDIDPADVLDADGALDVHLDRAAHHMGRADDQASSPWLAPLKVLPVVGRQVRSADAMASASSDTLDVARDAVAEVRTTLDGPLAQGSDRVRVVAELNAIASRARGRLGTPDLGPSKALIGPLADVRAELADDLQRVHDVLDRGTTATAGLQQLLQGPTSYLLVAANNAEMRAGQGFYGSLGVLSVDDGDLRVSDVVGAPDVEPPPGAVVPQGDLADRWGWLRPTDDFRNLGFTPDFPTSAAAAADMWVAGGHAPVDGVLVVDPLFLRSLLRATGPVTVDGKDYTNDNIVAFLLNGQYAGIADFEAGSRYDVRKNELSLVTAAILAKVNGPDVALADLVRGMRGAAQGRHVLAWSSKPEQQAAWEATSVAGALTDRSLVVSVINRSAVKLDFFLPGDASVRLAPQAGQDRTDVTLTLQLRNVSPDRGSPYVLGPNPFIDIGRPVAEAEYVGILAVTLPGAASDIAIDGADILQTSGRDGPTQVLQAMIDLPRGARATYTITFSLPGEDASFRVEPTARFPDLDWDLNGRPSSDGQGHTVAADDPGTRVPA